MHYSFCILFLFFVLKINAYNAPDQNTILLPLNAWASQRVLTKVVAKKVRELGYNVEFVEIGSTDQWGALRKGIIHLQIEVWQSDQTNAFTEAVKKGFVIDAGRHTAQGREDWWYPEYVENICKGLPDWRALNKCSSIFSNNSKSSKGIFYTGPWNYRDADLIRSLKLNFKIERLKDANAIWTKLRNAKKIEKPIILLNWTPNWIDVRIKGRFVNFPKYEEECETDPGWGVNKNMLYDCGNSLVTILKKAAWPGLKKKYPCIFLLLKNIDFTNDMISEAAALVVVDGYTEEKAVSLWLKKYSQDSKKWLGFECPLNLE